MRKFLHIFLALALIVAQSPVGALVPVAEAAEDLPTYSNPMNGEAGANFTGAIKWLQDNNAFDTMQDVTVAILDDGVDISNPYIDENAFLKEESKSFIPGEGAELALNPPTYSDGHGTTMASVIGGKNGLGALSGVSGVNYISYRYYEYNYQSGDRRGIVDSEFRPQLLAALNSLYTYATTDEKGSELKVALITGAMSRAVKMILDETPNRIDTTKPRRTDMGDNAVYYYDEEIGFNDKDSESGFDDVISQDRELETAIVRLHNAGVSVVVAENNLTSAYSPGADSTLSACPAFYDGVLAVTAVNNNKEIASWPGQREVRPDYTPNTDIAGYGSNENAADWWVAVSGARATSSHVSKTSGTSIAAAQVAAAIALTAKAECVGKSVDWKGTDAEDVISGKRYYDCLDSFAGQKSSFNGAGGVLNVYKAFQNSIMQDGGLHYHTFDTGWTSDDTGHWHRCIGKDCDNQANIKNFAAAEYGEHTFGSDNKCTVCGYEKKTPETPEADLEIDIPQDIPGNFEVLVNGQPAEQGTKVKEGDSISLKFRTWNSGTDLNFISRVTINGELVWTRDNYDKRAWDNGIVTFEKTLNSLSSARSVSSKLKGVSIGSNVRIGVQTVSLRPVYRLYNEITSEHLFTDNKGEYDTFSNLYYSGGDVWKPEGIDWFSAVGQGSQIIRLYNPGLGALRRSSHYYTSSEGEANYLCATQGWQRDGGITFYDSGSIPIYTAYSEALRSAHHYTSNYGEYRNLDGGWDKEFSKNGYSSYNAVFQGPGSGVFKCQMASR